jgi:Flp pilus assembly protein TadD
MAIDLDARNLTGVGATFARFAAWLDPDSSEGWLIAAELVAKQDKPGEAVALLGHITPQDPFADIARDQRSRLLVESGDTDAALAEAQARAQGANAAAGDFVRLGEVLMAAHRPSDAATAFARAVSMRGDADIPRWSMLLAQAGALDAAGDWPGAKRALTEAYRLAPTEPLVLNYLGYGQLERRENIDQAERLLREAHRLAPQNAAITDSLGWALFLKGDHAQAVQLLETAAQAAPADVEINEHLGDAYFAVGRRLDARFAWRAARVYAEGDDARRIDAKLEPGSAAVAAH